MSDETEAATPPEERGTALEGRLGMGLLVLRLSLGLFLLQWAVEKFVLGDVTQRIYSHFYKIDLSMDYAPFIGVAETAVAVALLIGLYRRISYGLAFLIHFVSTAASWQQLIDPYGLMTGSVNHLFAAGVPVLAGFWLLYWLRDWDTFTIDARYRQKA